MSDSAISNSPRSNSKFAFVFPGQGSQAIAMLDDFANDSMVKQTIEESSDVLGYDLWKLISQGPADELNQTHRTQPALLATSTALWRLWQKNQPLPIYLAGHSLGEYSALVAAQALDFATALKLVEARGEFMQKAVPEGIGKMSAIIGLSDELITQACEDAANGQIVSPVNFNSPGQVVIAGEASAVERAMQLCKDKGAKRALPLPVSVPSHCALMQPAAAELKVVLADIEISAPKITLVNNVDVSEVSNPNDIKEALIKQLYSPVRWTETINHIAAQGVNQMMECGPGKVLSGLSKRIDRSLGTYQLGTKDLFDQSVDAVS